MGMGPTLRIFGIHTESLTIRAERFHGLLQTLRTSAQAQGYNVFIRLVTKPDTVMVQEQLQEYSQKVVYEPLGDAEFDAHRQTFSTEMISNIEKHREAWRRIAEFSVQDPGDLFMVIEDDAYMLPDGNEAWNSILKSCKSMNWDMLHLGLSHDDPKHLMIPLSKVLRVLPSKDAYFITPDAAKRLHNELYTKFRYILRVQLSWYASTNSTFKVMMHNKRCFADGSKLGIFTSSIHVNNVLVFNNEFMTLLKVFNSPRFKAELKTAQTAYKQIEGMMIPEAQFLMGKIQEKLGNPTEAMVYFNKSLNVLKTTQGIINGRSELITSMISIYQHSQPEVEECRLLPSKYSEPDLEVLVTH